MWASMRAAVGPAVRAGEEQTGAGRVGTQSGGNTCSMQGRFCCEAFIFLVMLLPLMFAEAWHHQTTWRAQCRRTRMAWHAAAVLRPACLPACLQHVSRACGAGVARSLTPAFGAALPTALPRVRACERGCASHGPMSCACRVRTEPQAPAAHGAQRAQRAAPHPACAQGRRAAHAAEKGEPSHARVCVSVCEGGAGRRCVRHTCLPSWYGHCHARQQH